MAKTPIFPLPTARSKPTGARPGYTLAELLVVLVILGLVTALAAPRILTRSDPALIRKDSALLVSTLRSASIIARRTGVSTRVFIDPEEKQAWIEGQNRTVQLDPNVSLSATGADVESMDNAIGIRFFADGMSTGGEIKLALGTINRTIEVIWASGEVRFAPE